MKLLQGWTTMTCSRNGVKSINDVLVMRESYDILQAFSLLYHLFQNMVIVLKMQQLKSWKFWPASWILNHSLYNKNNFLSTQFKLLYKSKVSWNITKDLLVCQISVHGHGHVGSFLSYIYLNEVHRHNKITCINKIKMWLNMNNFKQSVLSSSHSRNMKTFFYYKNPPLYFKRNKHYKFCQPERCHSKIISWHISKHLVQEFIKIPW